MSWFEMSCNYSRVPACLATSEDRKAD